MTCAAALAALVVALAVLGRELHAHLTAIESWIADLGAWGLIAYIVLFVALTSVFVPDTLMAIIAGALFGLAWGMVAVAAGGLLAAALQYALARRVLKGTIERAIASKPALVSIERAVRKRELYLQALVRLTPLSPAATNYVLGAAGVKFPGFVLASVFLIPAFFIETYFGYAGRHIARIAGRDEREVILHDAVVLGGFVLAAILMFIISRVARKALQEAAAEPAEAQPGL